MFNKVGFEFEPQISFENGSLAKKKICFIGGRKFSMPSSESQSDNATITLPYHIFYNYCDSSIKILEFRNTSSKKSIKDALFEINRKIEHFSNYFYQLIQIRFALFLPSLFYDKQILTKHFNIDLGCLSKRQKEILSINVVRSANFINNFFDYKDNNRLHIRLPYRFSNYSTIFTNYIKEISLILHPINLHKYLDQYDGPPIMIGYINNWGKWKWQNKVF